MTRHLCNECLLKAGFRAEPGDTAGSTASLKGFTVDQEGRLRGHDFNNKQKVLSRTFLKGICCSQVDI